MTHIMLTKIDVRGAFHHFCGTGWAENVRVGLLGFRGGRQASVVRVVVQSRVPLPSLKSDFTRSLLVSFYNAVVAPQGLTATGHD